LNPVFRPFFWKRLAALPWKKKGEFLKRSPANYMENLSKVPLMIYWSAMDSLCGKRCDKTVKKNLLTNQSTYPASQIYDKDTALGPKCSKFLIRMKE